MEFLIITGLSGAGKSRAADVLEDLDYYCVDNMPVALIPRFAEFCAATRGRYEKVALVTDVREKENFGELLSTIETLRGSEIICRILYMDADVPVLIRRYKESRRPHPLAGKGVSVEEAVRKEMALLAPVKEQADFVVNTSRLTLGQLQSKLYGLLCGEEEKRGIDVTVLSFGYKHGLPAEADLVFDARFLPNPFYVDELREKSGLDLPVKEYVFSFQQTRTFMEQLETMLEFLLPLYIEEGKLSLTVAIGCTGGRHRSVAIATALNDHFLAKGISSVNVNRDIDK
ncbi:MAG: RNase adapter RapZ [Oscillospiraceae bacterium]|nr:RNase adapter RapZ [Oscillospiraceae bacterium]